MAQPCERQRVAEAILRLEELVEEPSSEIALRGDHRLQPGAFLRVGSFDFMLEWRSTASTAVVPDFAAVIVPGLHLAFQDWIPVTISDDTVFRERATRQIKVCGPAAFVVLKALAFRNRGENKDAYDVYYMIRNFGRGVEEVASRLRPLLNDPSAKLAITILGEDFLEHDGLGARRVAAFLNDGAPRTTTFKPMSRASSDGFYSYCTLRIDQQPRALRWPNGSIEWGCDGEDSPAEAGVDPARGRSAAATARARSRSRESLSPPLAEPDQAVTQAVTGEHDGERGGDHSRCLADRSTGDEPHHRSEYHRQADEISDKTFGDTHGGSPEHLEDACAGGGCQRA